MNDSLTHRGPDGEGYFTAPHLAMAMRRLSIIDLKNGWQPLYNEDKSLAIIANGEIYNYIELRESLQKKGHRLSTDSDIETILHLYEDHGLDFVQHLRGMFVFALWDEKRKRLVLARDRIGEKPLYLFEDRNRLLFASELRTILRSKQVDFKLDPIAVNQYFFNGYVPEPMTPIKGVRKLPAGNVLIVDVDPWKVTEYPYWRFEDIPPLEGDPSRLIRAELERASELVIRSDVPVGIALSGGLDSSAIAILAARKYPGVLQAFSVGYPGRPDYDERNQAKELSQALKIPLHEIELTTDEHTGIFPGLVGLRDDPIADISGFGYYAVARKAREMGVPVLLQGQGGDELFWGYEWVRQAAVQTIRKQSLIRNGWQVIPQYLRPSLPLNSTPSTLAGWLKSGFGVLNGLSELRRDQNAPQEQMVFMEMRWDISALEAELRWLYQPAFQESLPGCFPADLYTLPQPWKYIDSEISRFIIQTYLLENGIVQGDRLSMANSVELRLPFVDFRLVETVMGLRKASPDHQKPPKFWLKEAVKDFIPASLLDRPKRGFQPPVQEWHKNIMQTYGPLLKEGYLVQSGIMKSEAGQMLSQDVFPAFSSSYLPFKALVLELWCRTMLDSGIIS